MAAQLWAGSTAVVSHRAAAGLFGLEGIPVGVVELLTTSCRSDAPVGITIHRTKALGRGEWGQLGMFRLTGPVRTLLDLAAVVDPIAWEVATESAIRKDSTLLGRLADRIDGLPGRGTPGLRTLREFLAARDPKAAPTESGLETLMLRLVLEAGLPPPVRQYEVFDGAGFVIRLDFAYPEIKLAILTDGYESHMGRLRFERDRKQATRLGRLGWAVLYITWRRLKEEPEQVKADLVDAYARATA
ncbi:MAG: hypothetical protein ACRDJU_08365 [Actinomycetota bacterium]